MTSLKIKVFHVFAWMESIYALYLYHDIIDANVKYTYGGNWKFLTYINLHLQLVCFTMCVLTDLGDYLGFSKISSRIRQFKEVFYASIGLPISLTVFISFWALFLIDRELVFPKEVDNFIPSWANHLWHTAILLTVVEVACDRHQYPRRSLGLSICSLAGLSYLAWVFWINKQSGIWVYPVLAELEGISFVVFLVIEVMITWLIYLLGECINKLTGSADAIKKEKKKKN